MRKVFFMVLIFTQFSSVSFAEGQRKAEAAHLHRGQGHSHAKEDHKAELGELKSGVQEIKVKGMVCEVCAYGIRKALESEELVKAVDVNIKDHMVKIEYKDPAKVLSKERLSEILRDAGYELDAEL